MSRTIFYGPKDVRAIEIQMYFLLEKILSQNRTGVQECKKKITKCIPYKNVGKFTKAIQSTYMLSINSVMMGSVFA